MLKNELFDKLQESDRNGKRQMYEKSRRIAAISPDSNQFICNYWWQCIVLSSSSVYPKRILQIKLNEEKKSIENSSVSFAKSEIKWNYVCLFANCINAMISHFSNCFSVLNRKCLQEFIPIIAYNCAGIGNAETFD